MSKEKKSSAGGEKKVITPEEKKEEKTEDETKTQEVEIESEGWFKPIYLLVPLIGLPIIGLIILTFMPFYPNLTPQAFRPQPPPELTGPMAQNSDLNEAELLFSTISGAESIAFLKDALYTGLLDGRVIQVEEDQMKTVVDCDNKSPDQKCGRPLGLRADPKSNKTLFVADCIKGLYKVDVKTGRTTLLFPAFTYIAGEPSVLIDDLTVSTEGDVYFTVASTKWGFHQMHFDFIESAPNGRILHYDPRTNTTQLLLDRLYFPNGIQLEPGENSFLFCESSRQRILRYYLRGPNRGGVEIVAANLNGIPDNIRASGRGTYWVALVLPRVPHRKSLVEMLYPFPWLRQVIVRAPYLATLPFQIFDRIFQSNISVVLIDTVDSLLMSVGGGLGSHGLIIEVDAKGNVIQSLHSPNGTVNSISQATEHKGTLYLGSPWTKGVWKLPLDKNGKVIK